MPLDDKNFGCHLFKFDHNSELLTQIDDRIDIIEKCDTMFYNINGINFISLWRNLYKEIEKKWMENSKAPMITLNKLQETTLLVVLDIVAQFFLYNGSNEDGIFLKTAEAFFKDVNQHNEPMTTIERWDYLRKQLELA